MIAKVVSKNHGAPTSTGGRWRRLATTIIITCSVVVVCNCICGCVCGCGCGCGLRCFVFGLSVSEMVLLTQKHVLPLEATFLDWFLGVRPIFRLRKCLFWCSKALIMVRGLRGEGLLPTHPINLPPIYSFLIFFGYSKQNFNISFCFFAYLTTTKTKKLTQLKTAN